MYSPWLAWGTPTSCPWRAPSRSRRTSRSRARRPRSPWRCSTRSRRPAARAVAAPWTPAAISDPETAARYILAMRCCLESGVLCTETNIFGCEKFIECEINRTNCSMWYKLHQTPGCFVLAVVRNSIRVTRPSAKIFLTLYCAKYSISRLSWIFSFPAHSQCTKSVLFQVLFKTTIGLQDFQCLHCALLQCGW